MAMLPRNADTTLKYLPQQIPIDSSGDSCTPDGCPIDGMPDTPSSVGHSIATPYNIVAGIAKSVGMTDDQQSGGNRQLQSPLPADVLALPSRVPGSVVQSPNQPPTSTPSDRNATCKQLYPSYVHENCPPHVPEGCICPPDQTVACCEVEAPPSQPPITNPPQQPPSQPEMPDCCKQTADAIGKLADILEKIASVHEKKLCERLDELDACTEELVNKLRDKILPPAKSCEQCCERIKLGLATQTECANVFANCTCQQCADSCGAHNMTKDGDCCKGCGQERCVCKGYECVPAEEPSERWFAYCNPETQDYAVYNNKDDKPPAGYNFVGEFDDKESANNAASIACKSGPVKEPNRPLPVNPPQVPSISSSKFCDVNVYATDAGINSLFTGTGSSQLIIALDGAAVAAANSLANSLSENPVAGPIAGLLAAGFSTPFIQQRLLSGPVANLLGCQKGALQETMQMYTILTQAGDLMGLDVNRLAPQYEYAIRASCRAAQISTSEAIACYLGNAIDYTQLDSYLAIAGLCPESTSRMVQAAKTKLTPNQLVAAKARRLIDDNGYSAGMRENGYVDQQYVDFNWMLSEQVPGLSDIIRFMVRDAGDENIVNKFDLDAEFHNKYGSKLREWAEWQRIPEEVAKYAWRAHWSIPSPTQLFEFWRRLRKDSKFGTEESLREEIKAALTQQDILPRWQDHYLAVSTLPLTRTDVRRAFDIGVLDRDAVVSAYIAAGYNDDDAETLTKFTEQLKVENAPSSKPIRLWTSFVINGYDVRKRLSDRKFTDGQVDKAMQDSEMKFLQSPYVQQFQAGRLNQQSLRTELSGHGVSNDGIDKIIQLAGLKVSRHVAVDHYLAGSVTYDSAKTELINYGVNAGVADSWMKTAKSKIEMQKSRRCNLGYRRRYLTGEFDQAELRNQLVSVGFTSERADELISMYNCEKSSIGKQLPANTLCGWLERGAISSQEFVNRMIRVGYSQFDAEQLMFDCLGRISVRREEEARRIAKDQAQQQDKAKREAEKRRKMAETELARLERNRKKAADLVQKRQRQVLSVAGKIAKKCDCEIYEAVEFVKQQIARIQTASSLDKEEAIQVMIAATEEWGGGELASIIPVIDAMAGLSNVVESTLA
jgi:hypothetical protein